MAQNKTKTKSKAMLKVTSTSTSSSQEPETLAAVLKRLEKMEGKFQQFSKAQAEKEQLEVEIEELRAERTDKGAEEVLSSDDMISRPAGTSGKDWSLQVEMGLAASLNGSGKYKALLRGMRDLVLNANIKWEVGWKDIPPSDKSKMFQVARERYPILKRYVNDWATAEMVKQYIKNKRAHHYNNGWLPVPEKYAYLKKNSHKRNPTASRVKRAKVELAAKTKAKRISALDAEKRRGHSEDPDEEEVGPGDSDNEDDEEGSE